MAQLPGSGGDLGQRPLPYQRRGGQSGRVSEDFLSWISGSAHEALEKPYLTNVLPPPPVVGPIWDTTSRTGRATGIASTSSAWPDIRWRKSRRRPWKRRNRHRASRLLLYGR
eukprot:scaffold529_cov308-Pinguiococcus_pyrenoidosus.AAC.79